MDIQAFIQDWLALSNAYDMANYLKKYHKDAILDDPSVGQVFEGHAGIRKYFEEYFIGYKTQTSLVRLDTTGDHTAHLKVEFSGDFPGGKVGGTFDFVFKGEKIATVKAALI